MYLFLKKNLINFFRFILLFFYNTDVIFSKKSIFEKKFSLRLKKKSLDTRLKYINNLKNIYPNKPQLYLESAKVSLAIGIKSFINDYENYNKLNEIILKNTGLMKLNIRILDSYLFTGSFGNSLAVLNIILANKYNLTSGYKLCVFLNKKEKLTNKALFEYFADDLNVVYDDKKSSSFVNNKYLELPVGTCLPLKNSCPALYFGTNIINQINKKNSRFYDYFKIKEHHYKYGRKILKEFNLPNNAWYVSVHIREGSLNDKESYRNSSIKNFYKSIKHITDQGGYVFRVGDSSMTPFPKMKNVIDYAHSNKKSEIMDIFLGATSKFLIGTASGFWPVCSMFKVPVILTNTTQTSIYYALSANDIFLPKKVFKINSNGVEKILKLRELMKLPISTMYSNKASEYFNQKKLIYKDNNEEEILIATELMFNFINKKFRNIKRSRIDRISNKILQECSKSHSKAKLKALARIPSKFFKLNPDLL